MNKPTIGLLIEDLECAKNLSTIFKKIGHNPFVYESVSALWKDLSDNIPTLVIVDLCLIGKNENLVFLDHPAFKNEKLDIAFFYKPEFAPLMISTYEVPNVGTIEANANLEGQVKTILNRVNSKFKLKAQLQSIQEEAQRLSAKADSLSQNSGQLKTMQLVDHRLRELINLFYKLGNGLDFFNACQVVFDRYPAIDNFAILELSHNRQRLFSPTLEGHKYIKLSSVWLGQTATNGIDSYAHEMANQLVLNELKENVISLLITQQGTSDKLIYLKVDEKDVLEKFDWELFEKFLSGFAAQSELTTLSSAISLNQKEISAWELMKKLDESFTGLSEDQEEMYLVDVDFAALINYSRANLNNRFHWTTFINDFLAKMSKSTKIDYQYSFVGVKNIAFWVGASYGNDFFNFMKKYTQSYTYWRHFDQIDSAIDHNLRPLVRAIPLAPEAYFRHLEGKGGYTSTIVSRPESSMKIPSVISNKNRSKEYHPTM